MRVMLSVEMDTAKGNELAASGRIGAVVQGIMEKLQPEAAYFHARHGRRGMTLIVDAADDAALPSLAEPLWLELDATVEVTPCMNAADLATGIGRLS